MFSNNLKLVRQSLSLSQKELAEKIGLQQAQYSRYEIGSSPSTEILKRMIETFNININYLLTGKGAMFITPELSKETLQFKIPKNTRVLLDIEE